MKKNWKGIGRNKAEDRCVKRLKRSYTKHKMDMDMVIKLRRL